MMPRTPDDILYECAETYEKKNEDYGDSWRTVGEVLYMFSDGGVELNTVEDFISFGLFTRRLDKMARAFHGEFNTDEMNFEDVVDSHEDEATYAAMAAANQKARCGCQPTTEPKDEEPTDTQEYIDVKGMARDVE